MVRVETTDAAGNISSSEVIITVDATPPALILTPVSTPTIVTSQTINGTVEAGATVIVTTNTAATAIRRLRKKIDDPFETKLIHTVRGVGYVLKEQ